MRIIRYLKITPIAALLIFLLLIVQAFTELSLPRYTSDIVDVGIQQSGIEHAAVNEMSADTFDLICMLVSDEEESLLRDAYALSDSGTYCLKEEYQGEDELSVLDEIVSLPLVAVYYADSFADFDLSEVQSAYESGLVSKTDILAALDNVLATTDESLLSQQAISAAISEYEAVGYDLDSAQMSYLLRLGARMLLLAALGTLAAISVDFIASRSGAKIARLLRQRLFSRVVAFSEAEVQRFSAASLITRGTNDIQQIQMTFVMMLRMILYSPILAIGGIVMISMTNISMSWVIVLAIVCLFIVISFLMILAMPKFRLMQKLIDRVNLVARDILTGLPVIRAFGRQDLEAQRFDQANTELMRTQLFTNRVMTFMMPSMMLIMNGVSVLIIWVGGGYIDQGTLQTGEMIAFITYSMVVIMSFLIIGMVSVMLPRADVAAARIDEVLETSFSIQDPKRPRDAELPQSGGAEISFHDVSFTFPDEEGSSQTPVLEHISFTIAPGSTCAIIGSTGSGKSTIIQLIERFYDVTSGSICIDGIDIRDLSQRALRTTLGYVPQKAFLFTGSIGENVAYSDQDMTQDRIEWAVSLAQASDFIAEKDEGFDSLIVEGGTNVSGGQRQRLCIARALASNSRALLLDDCFSALDYRTDAALRRALNEEAGDRSVLIVAQRIATVLDADQIIVLDEGRVVGTGTHDELMESCDAYREIALSQLSAEELMGAGAA